MTDKKPTKAVLMRAIDENGFIPANAMYPCWRKIAERCWSLGMLELRYDAATKSVGFSRPSRPMTTANNE